MGGIEGGRLVYHSKEKDHSPWGLQDVREGNQEGGHQDNHLRYGEGERSQSVARNVTGEEEGNGLQIILPRQW